MRYFHVNKRLNYDVMPRCRAHRQRRIVCQDTDVIQLCGSVLHQTLQPKRTHDIQPIGGRLATPLSRATTISVSHRHRVGSSSVVMVTRLSQQHSCQIQRHLLT